MPPVVAPIPPSDDDTLQHSFSELWEEARKQYEKETGRDLRSYKFAKGLLDPPPSSPPVTVDTVVQIFEEQTDSFKGFRNGGKNIQNVLKRIVYFVLLFNDVAAEAAAVRISALIASDPI